MIQKDNTTNHPRIMYDQTQFTPLYLIDKNGVYLSDEAYFGSMELSGYAPEYWCTYTQNKPGSFFFGAYSTESLEKEAEVGYKTFTDTKFLEQFESDAETIYKKTRSLKETYFSKFKDREKESIEQNPLEVAAFIREIQKTGEYIISRYILTQPQRLDKFESEINQFLPDDDLELLLATGRYLTYTTRLRKNTLDLTKDVKTANKDIDVFLKENTHWKNTIEQMTENLGFLGWTALGGDIVDLKYVKAEVNDFLKDGQAFEKEAAEMQRLVVDMEKRTNIIERSGDKKEIQLADISGHLPVLRFNIHTCELVIMKYLENLVLAAAEKYDLTADEIHSFYFDDVVRLIESGELVSSEDLKCRQRGFLRVYTHKGVSSYLADAAHKEIKELLRHREEEMEITERVSGTVASWPDKKTDCIEGECFVMTTAFNAEELIESFKEGQILVATQTHPSIVPIMKKASAIVTDEGGLTCHAAIVSRELGKPSVIGTRLATKIFKTGDRIEVNLKKATVEKK